MACLPADLTCAGVTCFNSGSPSPPARVGEEHPGFCAPHDSTSDVPPGRAGWSGDPGANGWGEDFRKRKWCTLIRNVGRHLRSPGLSLGVSPPHPVFY